MKETRQNVVIRPEEQGKKVLVRVRDDYPFTKDLAGTAISVVTNRSKAGGVVVPFQLYANSWHDPDLIFFDMKTKEKLGSYIPPNIEMERSEAKQQTSLVASIEKLVALMAAEKVQSLTPELLAQVGLGEQTAEAFGLPVEDDTEVQEKALVISKAYWKKRKSMIEEETSPEVLDLVVETLGKKTKQSSIDKKDIQLAVTRASELRGEGDEDDESIPIYNVRAEDLNPQQLSL